MKSLSAPAAIATKRRWAAPVYLMRIDFTSPSAFTLYVSDAYRVALGEQWLPLVADWGTIDEVLNRVDVGGRPATAEVTLINSVPVEGTGKARLSDLIRTVQNVTGTYEFAFAKVVVTQLFEGLGSGDEVTLNVLYLEDPTEIGEERLTLRMSDQSLVLEEKLQLARVTKEIFPIADPEDVGKVIPVPFGVLKNIPVLAVVAGAAAKIAAAMTASSPANGGSLNVGDATAFPPQPGTVQIDDEQITYTGKSATSLTGIGRAANGTTAVAHTLGATVYEVRGGPLAYRYVVGENKGGYKIKSVSNIQADGVLQTSPTVSLEDTSLIPGRSFCVINFPALPVVKKQVIVSIQETIAVADQIGVEDNIAVSTTNTTTLRRIPTNQPLTISGTTGVFTSAVASGTLVMPPAPPGVVDVKRKIVFYVTDFASGMNKIWRSHPGGSNVLLSASPPSGLVRVTAEWGTGNAYGNQAIIYEVTNGVQNDTFSVTIEAFEETVETTIQINKSGAASRSGSAFKTGTVTLSGNSTADVVIGEVTCDVEGIRDDASGTISGTPNLLLENPADIAKAILLAGYGVAAADLGGSWATTRTSLATDALKWAFLLDYHRFSDLRRKLGEQARSILCLEGGKWEFFYMRRSPTAQLTLDYGVDVAAGARVSFTPRSEIRNSLWVYSQRDYNKRGALSERYLRAENLEDLSQFPDRVQYDLELDFVRDPGSADLLGDHWLEIWKRQRIELELTAWWNALPAEKTDYVAITNHPVLAAYGGAATVYQVMSKRYLLGEANPARVRLSLLEVFPVRLKFEDAIGFTEALSAKVQPYKQALDDTLPVAEQLARMVGVRPTEVDALLFQEQLSSMTVQIGVSSEHLNFPVLQMPLSETAGLTENLTPVKQP